MKNKQFMRLVSINRSKKVLFCRHASLSVRKEPKKAQHHWEAKPESALN